MESRIGLVPRRWTEREWRRKAHAACGNIHDLCSHLTQNVHRIVTQPYLCTVGLSVMVSGVATYMGTARGRLVTPKSQV